METFTLNYRLKLAGQNFKTGTYKVKNCNNELHAKMRLNDYFERQFKEIESIEISAVPIDKGVEALKKIFDIK